MKDIKTSTLGIVFLIVLPILNLFYIEVFSQQIKRIDASFKAKFISDTTQLPDSVCILTYPNGWFYDVLTVISKVDKSGNFTFQIPVKDQPMKIQIAPYRTDKSGKLDIIGEYFVLPNDKIQIDLQKVGGKTSLLFSGAGERKYNLVEKLKADYEQYQKQWSSLNMFSITDSSDIKEKLEKLATLVRNYNNKKNQLINDAGLEMAISKIIQYEYANYFSEWSFRTNLLFKKYPAYQGAISKYYDNHRIEFSYPADDLSIICPRYIIALTQRIKADLNILGNSGKVGLSAFFNTIKNDYSGKLRERLFIEFFVGEYALNNISDYNPQTYDTLVNEAFMLKDYKLLQNVISKKIRLKKGSPIFPSTFTGLNGNKISLSSLKGKVVLIDIWGAGCSGCIGFHTRFKKYVDPFFKNRTDFVVLSISIDKNKDKWLEGIKSGLYTSPEYINVYTGGTSINHEFIKFYDINATPFLLLVDKEQKVFAQFGNDLEMNDLRQMINGLIN